MRRLWKAFNATEGQCLPLGAELSRGLTSSGLVDEHLFHGASELQPERR